MKISELLKDGIYVLKEKNIEDSNLKARLLLSYLLEKPKEYLIINDSEELDVKKQIEYFSLIDRLINGEPLQYITGKQEFMGLDFFVNKHVLIPQPDTEILVQAVIKYYNYICGKENVKLYENFENDSNSVSKILDLCTGSGAIAISLSNSFQNDNVDILATDVSNEALEVAKINCSKNNANVRFLESDLFDKIDEKFDIIVSNPPYIETEVIDELDIEVRNEPHLALDGGIDGLDFYRKIAKQSKNYLNKGRNAIFRDRI